MYETGRKLCTIRNSFTHRRLTLIYTLVFPICRPPLFGFVCFAELIANFVFIKSDVLTILSIQNNSLAVALTYTQREIYTEINIQLEPTQSDLKELEKSQLKEFWKIFTVALDDY